MLAGRWMRLLDPDSGTSCADSTSSGRRSLPVGWRQRAGVRQLPAGEMLMLEEGYHRAFVLGDMHMLRDSDLHPHGPQEGEEGGGALQRLGEDAWMGPEDAWHACLSRNTNFPFLLAVYQHFTRAGWRVASGLKYGVTYLLYAGAVSARGEQMAPREIDGNDLEVPGCETHAHAPFAVCVVPPNCAMSDQSGPVKRKRGSGGEVDGDDRQGDKSAVAIGGDAGAGTGTATKGSETTNQWIAIQSVMRLAAHVSKKVIIAYVSYSPSPDGAGVDVCNMSDMDRIKVREFHVNRWQPAQAAGGAGAAAQEKDAE